MKYVVKIPAVIKSGYTAVTWRKNRRPNGKKSYQPKRVTLFLYCVFFGVTDGARTHDNRNHNPGLYQLSYSHHCKCFCHIAC
jgi:hypothetical protein